ANIPNGLPLAVYGIIATFNFVSRGSRYDKENDVCSIGLERTILLPVIFFDAVVNVYLTSLFLFPLLIPPNVRLRRLALRTFAGVIGTLAISIAVGRSGRRDSLALSHMLQYGHSLHRVCHSLDQL
ncbi:putative RING finger domain protein, partial [Colletotrichum scovillei]